MKNFLNKSKEKDYLSLGEYGFSPIMEASIALSLSFRKLHLRQLQQLPFFLSFPVKNSASIWLSVSLLVNFFLEDYVNNTNEIDLGSLRKGNKIAVNRSSIKITHKSHAHTLSPQPASV